MDVIKLIGDKVNLEVANGSYTLKCSDDVAEISMRFHERNDGFNRLSHLDIKFKADNKKEERL